MNETLGYFLFALITIDKGGDLFVFWRVKEISNARHGNVVTAEIAGRQGVRHEAQ